MSFIKEINLFGLKSNNEKNNLPNPFQNPFNKNCITSVRMYYYKEHHNQFSATVEFINNNTTGEQNFEGTNFYDLAEKIDAFINLL